MSMRNRRAGIAAEPVLPEIDAFRIQHLALTQRRVDTGEGRAKVRTTVIVDESESPLAWLARRRGRHGRALIEVHQLQAGERLRADFTRAHLMPRTTSNFDLAMTPRHRSGAGPSPAHFTVGMIAARQCVHQALDAVGPEFGGLLVDVCCFLKGLDDVERDRAWPARSGKVVLQLALERLARHYGYAAQVRGPRRSPMRTWLADDTEFGVECV